MSPEKKAIELLNKYEKQLYVTVKEVNNWDDDTKKCACIAVDETIEAIRSLIGDKSYMYSQNESEILNFWIKTRNYIYNLKQ